MDARIREFSQERELYPPHARIAQTTRTQCVCPFHDVLRYTQDMFAKMTELGLPLPRDEKRRLGDEVPSAGQLPELPDSFERESSKFWLQRGQVIPFVDLVTQKLGPYKFKEQKDSFNVITSIYLDNDAFDLYGSRVARRDGAQLVRFRW